MKYNIRQKSNFLFDKYHSSLLSKVQHVSTILKYNILVAFVESLSNNKSAENAIKKSILKPIQSKIILLQYCLSCLYCRTNY